MKYLIALICSALFLIPSQARAEIGACRTDPVVLLANGAVIDLTTSIGTSAANVNAVAYTITAPSPIVGEIDTPGSLGARESVTFTLGASYRTTTYVDTVNSGVAVTATTVLVRDTSVSMVSLGGHDHQLLAASF